MLEWALRYAGLGWHVFPIYPIVQGSPPSCSCGKKTCKVPGKHPRITRWPVKATTDPYTITKWWGMWPDAGIGVACGPSGLVVLDPDDADGMAELQQLTEMHSRLPPTAVSQTGRGFHLYFQGTGVKSWNGSNKVPVGKSLHVKADGGFVVVPPSPHKSGVRYAWVDATAVAPLPEWVAAWRRSLGGSMVQPGAPLLHAPQPAYLDASQAAADLTQRAIDSTRPQWSAAEETRVRELLRAISAEFYDQWVEAGMICHGLAWERGDGTNIGFEMWDEWSATCPEKYSRNAIEEKWTSFGKDTAKWTVGIGTLVLRARDAGLASLTPSGLCQPLGFPLSAESPSSTEEKPTEVNTLPAQLTAPEPLKFKDFDRFGKIKSTCFNTRIAIGLLGIACRYDVFHERMTVGGQRIDQWAGELSEHAVQMLRVMIREQFNFEPGQENAHDAAVQECLLHQYDPVRDYLNIIKWDGTPRLKTWVADYLGAARSEINSMIGWLSLIAAVRRQYQPGAKFDQIIVFEGKEGTWKSTALEILAGGENFSDQKILTLDDRAQQEAVQGIWIYEIADLVGLSRAEVESVKAFASRKVDRARPAYGRHRVDKPRRCIFFATTNESTYLQSQTGNRRFWPIATDRIAVDALARDRDQLWAEAVHVEGQVNGLTMPETLWTKMQAIQDTRREADPWDAIIGEIEADPKAVNKDRTEWRITTRDLYEIRLKLAPDRQTIVMAKRLAHAMRRLGWEGPKTIRETDSTFKGYTKKIPPLPELPSD
jgi:hypothetical protein